MDMALDHVVPESLDWLHTDEGPECVSLFHVRKADQNSKFQWFDPISDS